MSSKIKSPFFPLRTPKFIAGIHGCIDRKKGVDHSGKYVQAYSVVSAKIDKRIVAELKSDDLMFDQLMVQKDIVKKNNEDAAIAKRAAVRQMNLVSQIEKIRSELEHYKSELITADNKIALKWEVTLNAYLNAYYSKSHDVKILRYSYEGFNRIYQKIVKAREEKNYEEKNQND